MKIGFHTDAFNSAYFSFEKCLQRAQQNGVHYIECGLIDGVSWIHGLGYQPHVALYEDPLLLRRKMESYGVQFSQVDAAYPLSGKDGPLRGVPYVMKSIQWAAQTGCPRVDTTDGLHLAGRTFRSPGPGSHATKLRADPGNRRGHCITVNIEPHGYFTTKPHFMAQMLAFSERPYLRLNMDTGNTFIAGQDPVEFLSQFADRTSHIHVKDVSESLAAATRGTADGHRRQPVRLGRRRQCREHPEVPGPLHNRGYDGVVSMECEGQGGPMIERSLAWLRKSLAELGIAAE